MLTIVTVKLNQEQLRKHSIARIIVSLITILGVKDIVRQMLK